MQTIKSWIPNLLTCCNLLCGCLGIVYTLNEDGSTLLYASYFIAAAAIFDFLDGFAARLLNVHSEIGKQLDSLADMVTFGVLPGFIMYKLMLGTFVLDLIGSVFSVSKNPAATDESLFLHYPVLIYIAFLIPVFSALRLAKFNIDTRQSDSFIGLPTPANSIFIGSIPLISKYNPSFQSFILNPYSLIAISIIMSYLLVAPLPLFALKFKNFTWADNKIRYIFLVLSVVLIAVFKFVGIPLVILTYILLSLINNFTTKRA